MDSLKVGMVGLDTSHCGIFTKLLNDRQAPHYIEGAKMVKAIPFFSPELPISRDRVETFTELVEKDYGVEIVHEVAEFCHGLDGILLTAVDGGSHLDWVEKLVPFGIPIFIDKPAALSSKDFQAIRSMAETNGVPIISSSSLRFAESLVKVKGEVEGPIQSAYIYGPLPMQEGVPGYFWYGIHMIEMAVALLGSDVEEVGLETFAQHEYCRLGFTGGRSALIRGDHSGHDRFGIVVHTENETRNAEIWKGLKPYYASLLEEIIHFFKTGKSPVPVEETQAIINIIECIHTIRPRY